jgi:hypothetical protein
VIRRDFQSEKNPAARPLDGLGWQEAFLTSRNNNQPRRVFRSERPRNIGLDLMISANSSPVSRPPFCKPCGRTEQPEPWRAGPAAKVRFLKDWRIVMSASFPMSLGLTLSALVAGTCASAQNFDVAGQWSCSVVLYEANLQPYGYQAEISAQPNGGLFANGGVYDPNLIASVVPFQANGDWSVFPDSNGQFVRLRAHTQTHGILVFEGYATGATTLYLVAPLQSGGQSETQCTRTG